MKGLQLLLVITVLVSTGCSSFHRDWRKAARIHSADPLEGRWEGEWLSDSNGHGGRLRCLLTRKALDSYEARFHAKYKKILGFGYTAILTGVMTNDTFQFSGEADLGALAGGVYCYEGRADRTNFFSTYDSKYDRGTFRMRHLTVR